MKFWEISGDEDGLRLVVRPGFPEIADSWSIRGHKLRIQFETGRFVVLQLDDDDATRLADVEELLVVEFGVGASNPEREILISRE